MTFGMRIFVIAGFVSRALPALRGRTRIFLLLYKLLRLERYRVIAQARMRQPVPFDVELELNSWLQRVAFLTAGYEADTTRLLIGLHSRLGARGYLLDVGANVGLIAIPFAKLITKEGLRVVAVEVVPDNAEPLRRNIALNDLGASIVLLSVGLADERATVDIQVEGDLRAGQGSGTANILAAGSTYECVRRQVDVETLDSLAGAERVPDGCTVIKIDTDGYDLKVLQGAKQFILRNRPVIFGEFSQHCLGWHGQSVLDVVGWSAEHGYETWRRVLPGWRFTRDIDAGSYQNDLLLVPKEHVSSFSSMLR